MSKKEKVLREEKIKNCVEKCASKNAP